MENIFSKVAVFIICASSTSCAFDGEYSTKEVAKIGEGYNVVKDTNTPDYGFMIEFNSNKVDNNANGEIVASNCIDIYRNKDTIMYSKIIVQGDNATYYIIPISPASAGVSPVPVGS